MKKLNNLSNIKQNITTLKQGLCQILSVVTSYIQTTIEFRFSFMIEF